MKNLHNRLICQRAEELGYTCRLLLDGQEDFLEISNGVRTLIINKTRSHRLTVIAGLITKNKHVCSFLLRRAGIPVPDEILVTSFNEEAAQFLHSHRQVVVKPKDTDRGVGISMDVQTEEGLHQAIKRGLQYGRELLIQRQIKGRDYRILVIDQEVVAVLESEPPSIVGNGNCTIQQLIEELNADPDRTADKDERKPMMKVQIDEEVMRILATQGHTLMTKPTLGEQVYLRRNGNDYTGGINIDRTDEICTENIEIALHTTQVLGLDVAGLDVRTQDISIPLTESEGAILEVNVLPGIDGHVMPVKGKPRDVIEKYLKYLFKG
jgi:D-alanine-D-alanine ligase-like ATP-grasp enzyme